MDRAAARYDTNTLGIILDMETGGSLWSDKSNIKDEFMMDQRIAIRNTKQMHERPDAYLSQI